MNWLIAPVLASTGRVVTQSPLEQFSVVSNRFSVRKRILERDSHSLLLLSTHSGSGFHLRVAPNCRSHAAPTRHPEPLIEQALFHRPQKQHHESLLPPLPHPPHPPHFT